VREVARLEARIAAVEGSLSWRITAPLRWLQQRILSAAAPEPTASALARAVSERLIAPMRRAKRRLSSSYPDPFADYADWIRNDEAGLQAALYRTVASGPSFTLILTAAPGTGQALASVLDAVRGQLSPAYSLIVVCDGSVRSTLEQFARAESNATVIVVPDWTTAVAAKTLAFAKADADYIGFLDLPDCPAAAAMHLIGAAIGLDRYAELVFADEDVLDAAGRRGDPFFKPGFDPELHDAGDLLGRLLVLRGDLLRRIGLPPDGPDWFRVLGQRAVAAVRADRIRHIPAVLCHRAALDAESRWRRVRHDIPEPAPLVSVIVPTKNRADLLRVCVDGVLRRTDYKQIELVVLDNGSDEPEAIALLRQLAMDDPRVRILRLPQPFNWAALNNAGARAARGEILVLLNNDIAILQPGWLHELIAHAVRPEIGAAGARLLYPDGSLEHAGMMMDEDGRPCHVLRRAPADTGYLNGVFDAVHSVSIVTGACLTVRRDTFFEVGGLDEGFAISCNDVDFCLRLMAHGYRNVWTPFAVLEHREMATRGSDRTEAMRQRTAAELSRLSRNWGSAAVSDPYFNPNFVLVNEQPRLRPWADIVRDPQP
jgi:GT2 family glycosyltransferase